MSDWWNVDIRKFPGIDEELDATESWPYQGLRYIYAEHFLEHLTLEQALHFLTHARNALRPAGVLRLSTPNLEWVMHTHFQIGPVEHGKRLMDTLRTNRAFHGWGHQFLYSQEMLAHLLTPVGYESVQSSTYGHSEHPELDNLEKHGKFSVTDGFPSVVIFEAVRADKTLRPLQELTEYLQENYLRYVAAGH